MCLCVFVLTLKTGNMSALFVPTTFTPVESGIGGSNEKSLFSSWGLAMVLQMIYVLHKRGTVLH